MVEEIRTFKDLRDVLNAIPDEDLEQFGLGIDQEGDGEVCVYCIPTTQDDSDGYDEVQVLFKKHQETTTLLESYIKNILAWNSADEDAKCELDDFITSTVPPSPIPGKEE